MRGSSGVVEILQRWSFQCDARWPPSAGATQHFPHPCLAQARCKEALGIQVNYVVMNSAAVILFLTFQNVVELMNQIFVNPLVPTTFLVVLLFSCHIIPLTSHHLFGINVPVARHHLLLKGFDIIPTHTGQKFQGPKEYTMC
ncbi:unnamed protein product [Urochloa humidicola]